MSKKHGRENDTIEVEQPTKKSEVAVREEAIQALWEERDIFNKTLEKPAGADPKGDYVFYDGPPFATGLPHYGHILAGTIKDAIPRFWTMQGYRVRRKWGWDCHGLPLENLIEKELGLATKRDIENFGIKNFNEKARGAVMRYADEWKRIIPRFGRFADMENDYKTMDSSYTESVWWVFKSLHEKGLVYEGFKGMHLCPRCGTTLSNFEVNLGYKDIKDIAVTVKLPLLDDQGVPTDTSLLVWTTTPWTLPGNMAAAVHKDYEYVRVQVLYPATASSDEDASTKSNSEFLILAKERVSQLGDLNYQIVEEMPGSALVGRHYKPPFPYVQEQDMEHKDNAWQIYHADYVELGTEGTGAVHLAPAYGEEDMDLAKSQDVPIFHHVDEEGRFKDFVTDFAGQLVKPKDDDEAGVTHLEADIEIVKALQSSGALLKKENITHSYPHCWRCDTPLLNYATTSWFIEVKQFRDQLVEANRSVHWVPEHIGTNRFGKWLEGARDWAVSRQRYWGAPLPIWKNPKTGEYKIIGSLSELQEYVPERGNQFFLMRHGEAQSNVDGRISANRNTVDAMTDKGVEQVKATCQDLQDAHIDLVVVSPFTRTKQSAEIVAQELGLRPEQVIEDARLGEVQPGEELEGKTWDDYNGQFSTWQDRYTTTVEGQENRSDVQRRVGELLFELQAQYQGKNILLLSHGGTLFALESAAIGATPQGAYQLKESGSYFTNAEWRQLQFVPYPHNDKYELDFHRPYIDHIELYEGDSKLERIADVFDCWFESGSMPYGQQHYPFENAEQFEKEYFPAEFIAEGIDQTRGWFYSMMVLGVGLFGYPPYKNVITNGFVLAENGKKMSKSLQNYPDPMQLADRVGVDAIRYYLLSSPIMRAEDLNFSEKEVTELQRKNIGRLHNVLAMYEMYAAAVPAASDSAHILDRWIVSRLNQLAEEVATGFKNYEIDKATRPIADFIDDVSVWYLRRSRDRLKGDDDTDAAAALATLRFVLRELAKVIAPAMPFYAEYLFQAVREESDAESVHLTAWPSGGTVESEVLDTMHEVRGLVSESLEARVQAGIKVRQPLASVTLKSEALSREYEQIVEDELNVKKIIYDTNQSSVAQLDTEITPELRDEGAVREVVRAVQGLRSKHQLVPDDRVMLYVNTSDAGQAILESEPHKSYVQKVTGSVEIEFSADREGTAVQSGGLDFVVSIEKV